MEERPSIGNGTEKGKVSGNGVDGVSRRLKASGTVFSKYNRIEVASLNGARGWGGIIRARISPSYSGRIEQEGFD